MFNFYKNHQKIFIALILGTVVLGVFSGFGFYKKASAQVICQGFGASCTMGCDKNNTSSIGRGTECKVGDKNGICLQKPGSTVIRCTEAEKKPDGTVVTKDASGKEIVVPKQQYTQPTSSDGDWDLLGLLFGKAVDFLAAGIAKIIAFLSSVIFTILGWFVRLAAGLYDYILKPGDPTLGKFTQAPIVKEGWKISRDLANMFFSLILIVVSFATILKIESYGVKNLIKNIVIAALLINFSLVIGGVIIDFSQVLTKYFFNSIGGDRGVSARIMDAIDAEKLLKPPATRTSAMSGEVDTSALSAKDDKGAINKFAIVLVNMIFGSIILIVTAFVLFAGALLLIIRVIALWFLLILAPLAWLAYILPATSSYFHTWWQKFFKQVFFAPAYGFFLYLAIRAMGLFTTHSSATSFSAGFVINYIIIIGLLFGALIAAQQLGAYGASGAVNLGKKWGKGAAYGFGRMTERWAARGAPMPNVVAPVLRGLNKLTFGKLKLGTAAQKYDQTKRKITETTPFKYAKAVRETIPTLFSPTVWKKAVASRRARAEASSFPKAIGRLEGLIGLSVEQAKIKAEQAKAFEISKKQDEISKVYKDEDRLVDAYTKAKDPVEREAMLRQLAVINGLNSTLLKIGNESSPEALKSYLAETFGKEDGARIGTDIASIAASNGNFSWIGMSKWNGEKQAYEFTDEGKIGKDHLRTVETKMKEWEPQDWARRVHPDAFFGFKKDDRGNVIRDYTKFHIVGETMIKNMTFNHAEQVNRLQPRTLEVLYSGRQAMQNIADDQADPIKKQNIEKFIKAVEDRYEGRAKGEEKGKPTIAPGTMSRAEFEELRKKQPGQKPFG